jgi:glutamate/tyrosine decarboxylase-like PLP-dependent enzyme
LKGLHRTFNGEQDYLREAIGLMYSLDLAAWELMRTPSVLKDGSTAGPTFQLTAPGLACATTLSERRSNLRRMSSSQATFRPVLEAALQAALEHLEGLDARSVSATADLSQLRASLSKPLNASGIPPEIVLEELVRDARGGIHGNAGGRFFGWVIGGSVPAALAADWMTSAWDQNAGMFTVAPAASVAEEVAGAWLKDLLGLPAPASFALVTGCQMAHVTCLAAARNRLLSARGVNVERTGLCSAPAIRILTSSERHGSIERAVRLLGIGTDQIHDLAVDTLGRLVPEALEQALASDPTAPTVVILQAGDLNIGAYDDFATLIPIAKGAGAWVHIDGAFGLWAAASPRYSHLLAGAEHADSWATDGHKWLNVPYDSGFAFVAHREAHRSAMAHHASYLVYDDSARDQIDWNPEYSRRARGFATYAAIRQLGREGIADLVDRCCAHAHSLVTGLGRLPGVEVLWEPTINQGLVRFLSPISGANDSDHDRHTDATIAGILKDGGAFFGGTTWRGKRAMRISVCNWQTSAHHVARAIETVRRVLAPPGDIRL